MLDGHDLGVLRRSGARHRGEGLAGRVRHKVEMKIAVGALGHVHRTRIAYAVLVGSMEYHDVMERLYADLTTYTVPSGQCVWAILSNRKQRKNPAANHCS